MVDRSLLIRYVYVSVFCKSVVGVFVKLDVGYRERTVSCQDSKNTKTHKEMQKPKE